MRVTAPRNLFVPYVGRVKAGESIEVDADLGAQLVAQGWTKPKAKKEPAKSAPEKAETAPAEPKPTEGATSEED